jgi:hypothetical protein
MRGLFRPTGKNAGGPRLILSDNVFFSNSDLKAYEGPVAFFLHDFNASRRAPTGNS